jgi:hypothetical protein
MTRTASGPVVPVTWAWGVTTESGTTTSRAAATGLVTIAGNTLRRTASLTDADGHDWSATGTASAIFRSDRRATSYVGRWSLATTSVANGGSLHRTATRYASASTTVTGSSIAVLLQRGARNGWVVVKIDGVRVAAVSMRGTAGVRAAFATTFPTAGTHTVTVTNMTGGTYGAMGFDGVAVLG